MPMPRCQLRPTTAPRTIDALIAESKESPEDIVRLYPWADRFVFGIPLAPWQRDFKWSPEQCERFVTSAWTGVHLGTYLITKMALKPGLRQVEYLPLSNMIIDGQQRLTALEMYLQNKFAVPDEDGKPTYWSEVDQIDQRRFRQTIFSRGEVDLNTGHELRRFYDLLNFGGVAHEEHERALMPQSQGRAKTHIKP